MLGGHASFLGVGVAVVGGVGVAGGGWNDSPLLLLPPPLLHLHHLQLRPEINFIFYFFILLLLLSFNPLTSSAPL